MNICCVVLVRILAGCWALPNIITLEHPNIKQIFTTSAGYSGLPSILTGKELQPSGCIFELEMMRSVFLRVKFQCIYQ